MMFRNKILLKRRIKRNKKEIITVCLLLSFVIVGFIGFAYFTTNGSYNGSATVEVLSFSPEVNGSTNMNQSINLSNTITNDKNLAPGAIGQFKLDVDFSSVGSNAYYKITYNRNNIPNNIHFYTNQALTNELTNIEGIHYADYTNKVVENYIYWKWESINTPESNTNDSLYMNQEISIPFNIHISQKINNN